MLLEGTYDYPLVWISVATAILASYVALELANTAWHKEIQHHNRWLIASSLAMGLGIWTMHFMRSKTEHHGFTRG